MIQECQPELVVAVIHRLVEALQADAVPEVKSWLWTGPGVTHVR